MSDKSVYDKIKDYLTDKKGRANYQQYQDQKLSRDQGPPQAGFIDNLQEAGGVMYDAVGEARQDQLDFVNPPTPQAAPPPTAPVDLGFDPAAYQDFKLQGGISTPRPGPEYGPDNRPQGVPPPPPPPEAVVDPNPRPEGNHMAAGILKGAGQIVEGFTGAEGDMGASQYEAADKRAIKEYLRNKMDSEKAATKAESKRRWDITSGQAERGLDIKQRAANLKASGGKGKKIGSAAAASIGELGAADKMLDDLYSDYKKNASAYGSGVSSAMPWSTDADKYDQSKKQKAQIIGGIMEGGKLSDVDFPRYMGMMPDPWDTDAQAANKIAELKQTLKLKKEGITSGLTQSGFDTSGIQQEQSAAPGPEETDIERLKRLKSKYGRS